MWRTFQVKRTGQWCAPAYEDDHFNLDDGLEDRVAEALGLRPGSLECHVSPHDDRSGPLLAEPEPEYTPEPLPKSPLEILEERVAALEKSAGRSIG